MSSSRGRKLAITVYCMAFVTLAFVPQAHAYCPSATCNVVNGRLIYNGPGTVKATLYYGKADYLQSCATSLQAAHYYVVSPWVQYIGNFCALDPVTQPTITVDLTPPVGIVAPTELKIAVEEILTTSPQQYNVVYSGPSDRNSICPETANATGGNGHPCGEARIQLFCLSESTSPGGTNKIVFQTTAGDVTDRPTVTFEGPVSIAPEEYGQYSEKLLVGWCKYGFESDQANYPTSTSPIPPADPDMCPPGSPSPTLLPSVSPGAVIPPPGASGTPTITPTATPSITPTITPTPTPPEIADYLCYQATFPAFSRNNVALVDALAGWTVNISRPNFLCAPADAVGNPESAPVTDHLTRYPVTTTAAALGMTQTVANRLGTYQLTLAKPAYLLSPAAKQPAGPVPTPASPKVDNFTCYSLAGARLQVTDQFATHLFGRPPALMPAQLCAPNDGPDNSAIGGKAHPNFLTCYAVSRASAFPTSTYFVSDRLGVKNAGVAIGSSGSVGKPTVWCIPATLQ